MIIKDNGLKAHGVVKLSWIDKAGHKIPTQARSNQLSYACADIMAQLMAGDLDYVPKYIGFLYGDGAADGEGTSVPSLLNPTTDRSITFADLKTEMASVHGNVQINGLTVTPSVSASDSTLYAGNVVTLSAHTITGISAVYGMPLTSTYATALTTGGNLYHVVLLAEPTTGNYVVVARATLGPTYYAKPEGFELSVDWQITLL